MSKNTLSVRIVEISGFCPVYRLGDEFSITAGYVLEGRENYCMHSIAVLMPYFVALSRGVPPEDLAMCKLGEDKAYIQCPDPVNRTGGGTVVLEITRTG